MTVTAPRKHDRTFSSVGVDGCRGGWFFVKVDPGGVFSWGVVRNLEELVLTASEGDRICVDIPIGLPDRPGERRCDKLARKRLGAPRGSSVFPAPARETLEATDDFDRAKQINDQVLGKAISKQTFVICPKIKEADDLLRRSRKARDLVCEVHPELCFWALAGQAMRHNKRTPDGYKERLAVLRELSPGAEKAVRSASGVRSGEFARDDVVDAAVAALTATASEFRSLPDEPPIDSCSLPMRMVYADRAALGRGKIVDRVPRSHAYTARLTWRGNRGEGTTDYKAYSRDYDVECEGKPVLRGSADSVFLGESSRHNPEDLLVASLAACHMLWYLHLCAVNGVAVVAYEDQAEGVMELNRDGSGQFRMVTLKPLVTITPESDPATAERMHKEANAKCFVARSVSFPVVHEPRTTIS